MEPRGPESARNYMWITGETRVLAVAAVEELRPVSRSLYAACVVVAEQFGVHPGSVRNWYNAALRARQESAGNSETTADLDMRRRLAELETVNAKLVERLRDSSGEVR